MSGRDAVSGGLERSRRQALNAHHGHREELEAHISGGLPDNLVAESEQAQERFGEYHSNDYQDEGVGEGEGERLEHDVVGARDGGALRRRGRSSSASRRRVPCGRSSSASGRSARRRIRLWPGIRRGPPRQDRRAGQRRSGSSRLPGARTSTTGCAVCCPW